MFTFSSAEKIVLITGASVSTDYVVSWVDHVNLCASDDTIAELCSPNNNELNAGTITSATTTIIISNPPANSIPADPIREIKTILITNNGGINQTVQLGLQRGVTVYKLSQILTLLPGESACYEHGTLIAIPAMVGIADATVVVAGGKTVTFSNSLTFTGNDGSTLAIGTGGTLGTAAYTAATAYEVAGAAATHAALRTGVHGINITAAKTFSCTNTLTLSGTDGSSLAIGTGGVLGTAAYTAATAYEVAGAAATHAALQTGIHGISITAGKTFSCQNTLTLSGTDSSTLAIGTGGTLGTAAYTAATAYMAAINYTLVGTAAQTYTFPTTTATLARTDAAQPLTGDQTLSTGSFLANTVGEGIGIKTGANAKAGTAVLVGGTVTVANTSVTANSIILCNCITDGGAVGDVRVSAMTAGANFVITSSNVGDTSTVGWMIVELIP